MLSESTIKIIRDISQLISEDGGECSDWHVGATWDVDLGVLRRLGIEPGYRWQICRCALSTAEAKAIVEGFRNLSCTEVTEPGHAKGEQTVYVFAYRKPHRWETACAGHNDRTES
jgi:hypothetical protein